MTNVPANSLPLLHLLQVSDSSFPVGGFAYSHGLEWLAQAGLVTKEDQLASFLQAYVVQAAGRQSLPAAHRAMQAPHVDAVVSVDQRLDASVASSAERAASSAMGHRLLSEATAAFGGQRTASHLATVESGSAPGHFAVAFACIAFDHDIEPRDAITTLGFTMISSITQAAVRLGLIGQQAMLRLNAGAMITLDRVVTDVMARPRAQFGTWLPAVDIASSLHSTLPFRMFAS